MPNVALLNVVLPVLLTMKNVGEIVKTANKFFLQKKKAFHPQRPVQKSRHLEAHTFRADTRHLCIKSSYLMPQTSIFGSVEKINDI